MNYIIQRDDSESLRHYGVLGMKWGVRRYQNKDGTLTTAGREHYRSGSMQGTKENDIPIGLAIYGAMVGAEVLAVSGLAVAGKIQQSNALRRDKKADARIKNAEIDPKTKMPLKKNVNATAEDDLKDVNPARGSGDAVNEYNCGYCTLAYDMRRRGYDVTAKKEVDGTVAKDFYKKYYKGAKVKDVVPDEYKGFVDTFKNQQSMMIRDHRFRDYQKKVMKQIESEILSQGDGARGYFGANWAGSDSAHSMAYEVSKGKVYVMDAQVATRKPIKDYTPLVSAARYVRLDNATPNYEQIRKDGVDTHGRS